MSHGHHYHSHKPKHSKDDHGHHHSHLHHGAHHSGSQAPQAIQRAILVTLVFMVVEFIGGWVANSLALMTDAAHMLLDVGAMMLSLFAIWISKKPVTPSMSFGYQRAEILGALTSGLLIWLISGLIIYEAVLRLKAPPEVQGPIVLLIATVGLIANLVSMRILHFAKKDNINVRAAYVHLIADSLGSVGAIVAGAVLWYTGWRPIDPIISIIFAVLMLVSSWELVKEAVGVLMESAPTHLDPEAVRTDLQAISGVQEAHDLHIWSVSAGRLALSVHLIATGSPDEVLAQANRILDEKHGIIHTTVQIEHPDRFQSQRCYDCTPIELKQAK